MSQRYLLDTNAASAILRQHKPSCTRAASVPLASLAISSVTADQALAQIDILRIEDWSA